MKKARTKTKKSVLTWDIGAKKPRIGPDLLRKGRGKKSTRTYRVVAWDIESKDGDTQKAGFDRPFLVAVDDAGETQTWRNDPSVAHLPYEQRAVADGGCLDRFMRYMLQPKFASRAYRSIKNREARRLPGAVLVAHNGGNFDIVHLLSWLNDHDDEYEHDFLLGGTRMLTLEVWKVGSDVVRTGPNKGKKKSPLRWRFWDSSLPVTLEEIGEMVGVPKLDQDLDMPEDDPSWETYVLRDCETLREGMKAYAEIVRQLGGAPKLTLPATGMSILRNVHLQKPIERCVHFHDCPDLCASCHRVHCQCRGKEAQVARLAKWGFDPNVGALKGLCEYAPDGCAHFFFRRALYGGRTEAFEKYWSQEENGGELYVYDFNSSYPASTREPMPVDRMRVEWDEQRNRELIARFVDPKDTIRETTVGFVEATVFIPPDCEYPPLPVRWNGKLTFPTGYLQGVWDVEELALVAHVGGEIRKTHRGVWFHAEPVLRPMIDAVWSMRSEARAVLKKFEGREALSADEQTEKAKAKATAEITKLIMNSSTFGKWGMRQHRERYVSRKSAKNMPERFKSLAKQGDAYDGEKDDAKYGMVPCFIDADYVAPQIADHITALARVRLWRAFEQVRKLGGRVWYCDTDSIVTNVALPESKELGGLKREYVDKEYTGNTIVRAVFETAKVYELHFANRIHRKHCVGGLEREKRGEPCPEGCSNWLVKAKGFEGVTPDDLEAWRRGEKRTVRRLPKVRGVIKNGFKPPKSRNVAKTMSLAYTKRHFDVLTGRWHALYLTEDDVVHEHRPKPTPNERRADRERVSVRVLEALWAEEDRTRSAEDEEAAQ